MKASGWDWFAKLRQPPRVSIPLSVPLLVDDWSSSDSEGDWSDGDTGISFTTASLDAPCRVTRYNVLVYTRKTPTVFRVHGRRFTVKHFDGHSSTAAQTLEPFWHRC